MQKWLTLLRTGHMWLISFEGHGEQQYNDIPHVQQQQMGLWCFQSREYVPILLQRMVSKLACKYDGLALWAVSESSNLKSPIFRIVNSPIIMPAKFSCYTVRLLLISNTHSSHMNSQTDLAKHLVEQHEIHPFR